ncbi:MAG: 7-carboxy-7-deazaguanine synthase QueE [Bacteroidales bacterium]|mgnify:CR=1 FL=1|nr:7-carboxy-7-deazaguanine synthase QueE [Bacteroidales bacterium]
MNNKNTSSGKMLPVMEQFASLQGEGINTGKAAWFVRLGGCDVGCSFCDVKESWNPNLHQLTPCDEIINNAVNSKLGAVVLTGGEPLQSNLDYLCNKLHEKNIKIFLETSGSEPFSGCFDWICLSPKKNTKIFNCWFEEANELKVIIESKNDMVFAEEMAKHVNENCIIQLQPEWSKKDEITPFLVDYIISNPCWRLSVQTHKYIKIP